ncbi:hypothetical protein [Arthrobacter psychrolactophilus]
MAPVESAPSAFGRAMSVISAFGPPVAVITALLVYFGWARSDAQARAMGLDVSLFGYSVQDYVLRSIRSLFLPLVFLAVVGIVWLAVDRWLTSHMRTKRYEAVVLRVGRVAVLGGALTASVLLMLTILQPGRDAGFLPYYMAAGTLIAAWGVRLRRSVNNASPVALTKGPSNSSLEAALVFTVVTLLLFWGTANFAQSVGRGLAVQLEQRVDTMPRASVYSTSRLAIGATNVVEASLGTTEAPLYRYKGLRLLVVSGGNLFFLHDG